MRNGSIISRNTNGFLVYGFYTCYAEHLSPTQRVVEALFSDTNSPEVRLDTHINLTPRQRMHSYPLTSCLINTGTNFNSLLHLVNYPFSVRTPT
jgi:hypothetical protein